MKSVRVAALVLAVAAVAPAVHRALPDAPAERPREVALSVEGLH